MSCFNNHIVAYLLFPKRKINRTNPSLISFHRKFSTTNCQVTILFFQHSHMLYSGEINFPLFPDHRPQSMVTKSQRTHQSELKIVCSSFSIPFISTRGNKKTKNKTKKTRMQETSNYRSFHTTLHSL